MKTQVGQKVEHIATFHQTLASRHLSRMTATNRSVADTRVPPSYPLLQRPRMPRVEESSFAVSRALPPTPYPAADTFSFSEAAQRSPAVPAPLSPAAQIVLPKPRIDVAAWDAILEARLDPDPFENNDDGETRSSTY